MIIWGEKIPALRWGSINKHWDFRWFGITFGQCFFGVMVRTKRQSD